MRGIGDINVIVKKLEIRRFSQRNPNYRITYLQSGGGTSYCFCHSLQDHLKFSVGLGGGGCTGLPALDIFVEMEIDPDVQLR